VTANLSQRRSQARHGAAAINATVDAAAAEVKAQKDAEWEAAKAASAERKAAPRRQYTREDMAGMTQVRDRFGWHYISRVNAKTVSVETAWSWVDRIKYDDVLEVR